jgi:poly(glycerol-phosphate) alpha-glucosyltransferase
MQLRDDPAGADARPGIESEWLQGGLPDGRQLAVTWGIPDRYGGMTSALLHRSRAFVRLAGREVDVLTFDPRPGYGEVRERLAETGELVRGIRLRNLYDELRCAVPEPGRIVFRPGHVEPDTVDVTEARDGSALLVARRSGRRVALEHRRADGTLAVLDERGRVSGPTRLVTAFDDVGEPVRQWSGAWEFYAHWFDRLIGTERAFALTDSKTVANFMAEYRRPNLVSLHVVHNSHLDSHLGGPGRPYARVRPSRRAVFARLERFDGVVFLTERQRADAAALLSDPGNLSVVPNGVDPPVAEPAPDLARDAGAGVVVAGLTRRKRVHHALDVVRRCRGAGLPVTLQVYGDGPDAATLRSGAADAGLADAVTFAGHRDDAAEAFATASWTLLTSTSEGSPLVLAEAMSRGCIPIAYDVPYGPADLIVDGVDGLLVPDGDRAAAAAAVEKLVAMAPNERERMREAARATAARHDDGRIIADWGRVQRAAARWHDRPAARIDASAERLRLRYRGGRLRVSVTLRGVPRDADVVLAVQHGGRGPLVRTRRPGRAGRTVWRLDEPATRFVGARHPLTCVVAVERGNAATELAVVTVHPDTRSLARRAVQRLTRSRRRSSPRSPT